MDEAASVRVCCLSQPADCRCGVALCRLRLWPGAPPRTGFGLRGSRAGEASRGEAAPDLDGADRSDGRQVSFEESQELS